MAEVIIASHKWRKRTRDFAALCDNALKLDRTYSLVNDPMKMNRYGVCAPDCEICITPMPYELTPKCSLRTGDLSAVMVLPPEPIPLTLPSQFRLSIVGGGMTSTVNSSSWLGCKRFMPGDALSNMLARSATQSMTIRGSATRNHESDWVYFGKSKVTLNFVYDETLNSNFPPNRITRSVSVTRDMEIQGFLSFVGTKNCPWGLSVLSRIKPNTLPVVGHWVCNYLWKSEFSEISK